MKYILVSVTILWLFYACSPIPKSVQTDKPNREHQIGHYADEICGKLHKRLTTQILSDNKATQYIVSQQLLKNTAIPLSKFNKALDLHQKIFQSDQAIRTNWLVNELIVTGLDSADIKILKLNYIDNLLSLDSTTYHRVFEKDRIGHSRIIPTFYNVLDHKYPTSLSICKKGQILKETLDHFEYYSYYFREQSNIDGVMTLYSHLNDYYSNLEKYLFSLPAHIRGENINRSIVRGEMNIHYAVDNIKYLYLLRNEDYVKGKEKVFFEWIIVPWIPRDLEESEFVREADFDFLKPMPDSTSNRK